MSLLHLNIGSNQDRRKNIRLALDQLQPFFTKITISSIFESPSEGFEGSDFYNVGVNVETHKSASEVIHFLHQIEDSLGRNRELPKFSSRIIDLDLVLYDEKYDRYYIYDIKTSTRGWGDKEKKNQTKRQQILLYKKFYSELYGVDKDKIHVEFIVVKRKVWDSPDFIVPRTQTVTPASGKTKILLCPISSAAALYSSKSMCGNLWLIESPPQWEVADTDQSPFQAR